MQVCGQKMAPTRSFTVWEIRTFLTSMPLSYADCYSTGYGWHGDYLFGWKDDLLQKALDARCTGDTCSALKTQTAAVANACMKSQQAQENTEGCKSSNNYT
jgi:hypothetical protein